MRLHGLAALGDMAGSTSSVTTSKLSRTYENTNRLTIPKHAGRTTDPKVRTGCIAASFRHDGSGGAKTARLNWAVSRSKDRR